MVDNGEPGRSLFVDGLVMVISAVGHVELLELGAKPPRLGAHDSVSTGFEGPPTVENIHSERIFLQTICSPLESLADNVTQQAALTWVWVNRAQARILSICPCTASEETPSGLGAQIIGCRIRQPPRLIMDHLRSRHRDRHW